MKLHQKRHPAVKCLAVIRADVNHYPLLQTFPSRDAHLAHGVFCALDEGTTTDDALPSWVLCILSDWW
jgi:hypothetical protein